MSVSISTHVLDTGAGRPAAGVRVELVRGRDVMVSGETDADGRIAELATGLEPARYALVFWPPSEFFTRVEVEVDLVEGHYHVPLLVSPYGCASYRGS
jgi:5-hydroxyisourate hydrolase